MKKIYIKFIVLLFPLFTTAQVKIGGNNGNLASENVILQFGEITDGTSDNTGDKGLLLPTIISDFITKEIRNEGTIFFDLKDGAIKYLSKVQRRSTVDDEQNSTRLMSEDTTLYNWDFKTLTTGTGEPLKHYNVYMNLISENPDDDLINNRSFSAITDYINLIKEKANSIENNESKGIIIGNQSSTADGALILEAENKGILLPRVYEPHLNIKNPDPGVICYDTAINMVAFFDGKLWHYWY